MRSRHVSAIAVILFVSAFAAKGFAIAQVEAEKLLVPTVTESNQVKSEMPLGPCGWFAPENCVQPKGCTAERINAIDGRAADARYADFLGAPTGGYVEIDDGCKRDFEEGTIYVSYSGSRSKLVLGPIRDLYLLAGETSSGLGWPRSSEPVRVDSSLRLPATDLAAVGSNVAALQHRFEFANGWVYWHPEYDSPRTVMDRIHDFFQAQGGVPELGLPRNDEGVDSHEGTVRFQAFEHALIYQDTHGLLQILRDELLDMYLEAASESGGSGPIEDPLEAEAELGVPKSGPLDTPNGSVRLLHNGTIYYRDGAALQVYPASTLMLDGVVVVPGANPDGEEMEWAIENDPYLADYRKDVVLEALSYLGLCGDDARDSLGTRSDNYCSEFVREVYRNAGVDAYLCGRRACLWAVTIASQLRRIFMGNDSWVYADDADRLTPEPGDYLSMDDQNHSAMVVAPSIDGRHLFRVGGNEDGECVEFSRDSFFDESGVINERFYGFGKLRSRFFD